MIPPQKVQYYFGRSMWIIQVGEKVAGQLVKRKKLRNSEIWYNISPFTSIVVLLPMVLVL